MSDAWKDSQEHWDKAAESFRDRAERAEASSRELQTEFSALLARAERAEAQLAKAVGLLRVCIYAPADYSLRQDVRAFLVSVESTEETP